MRRAVSPFMTVTVVTSLGGEVAMDKPKEARTHLEEGQPSR
jgi:hypothetical protein